MVGVGIEYAFYQGQGFFHHLRFPSQVQLSQSTRLSSPRLEIKQALLTPVLQTRGTLQNPHLELIHWLSSI